MSPPRPAAQTAGDEPPTAIPVGLGSQIYDSSLMTESVPPDPTSCGDAFPGPFSNTMWFSYTPTRDRLTVVDVNSFVSENPDQNFLAIVFVYAVTSSGLQLVGCSAFPATVVFPAEAGTTYLIMVAGLSAEVTGEPELSDRGGVFELTLREIRGRVLSERFRVAETFPDEFLLEECGFPVTTSVDDKVIVKTFYSGSAEARALTVHVTGSVTFTNTTTGTSVTFKYARMSVDQFHGTVTFVGLPIKVSVGGGTVILDAGKIVFNPETGEVTFEGGPHPTFYEPVDLCGLLSGSGA